MVSKVSGVFRFVGVGENLDPFLCGVSPSPSCFEDEGDEVNGVAVFVFFFFEVDSFLVTQLNNLFTIDVSAPGNYDI